MNIFGVKWRTKQNEDDFIIMVKVSSTRCIFYFILSLRFLILKKVSYIQQMGNNPASASGLCFLSSNSASCKCSVGPKYQA